MMAIEETKIDGRYAWAGWLAIASGVLLVPEVGLAVGLGFLSPDLVSLVTPIHIVNLVIGIYVLYMFRDLLNRKFDFHGVDLLVSVLIWTNVVFFFLGLIEFLMGLGGSWVGGVELAFTVVTLGLFVIFCLINIAFAISLLKMSDDLFGLLKPYAYLTIVASICGATILLSPFGLILSAVALVVLGMIFLNTKREAEIL